jgi:fumarate hydratase subunit alpha
VQRGRILKGETAEIMREIDVSRVTETVSRLLQDACIYLPDDVAGALTRARAAEASPVAAETLGRMMENAAVAAESRVPLCQDTGVAVLFLEIGQDVHFVGGDLNMAVNEGVRRAYDEGYLRKSMVNRPYTLRVNTRDNTPAVVHTDIVPGESLRIVAMPKGGGAENMTRLKMLTPAQGRRGVIDFAVETVEQAGSNPCPPVIVGVGIGGSAEKALLLAKTALLREVGKPNPDTETAELEAEILHRVNRLGIGAMGYGGKTTALAVHAEVFPAHIASLPVAVNLQCHSARHKQAVL